MVILLRRINKLPRIVSYVKCLFVTGARISLEGYKGLVMIAFNRLFSQTLAKLTNLKTLVIRMWESRPRSCKGLLQHCTFKLNLFYSWFFVDNHLSSFLEKQSDLRKLFLPKEVSHSFRLSDTALPKLRALGMDKGAEAALSIIRNRPVAYLRAGGYDHADTGIWNGLHASKSSIRGLVIPQVNVESLKMLAEVCPNLQAFYNINFRVVPVSSCSSLLYEAFGLWEQLPQENVWFEYFPRFPNLITAEFSIDERTDMGPILKRLKTACPNIVRVYVRIYRDSLTSMYRYRKNQWFRGSGSWAPNPFDHRWNGYANPWLCLVSHIM
jgi:hypothetical protein